MSRAIAHKILLQWNPDTHWAEDLIQRHATSLRDDDRRFVSRLVIGTLKNLRALDYLLEPRLRNGLDSVEPRTLWALRLGIEQLIHTRIPGHAAVAETVELVAKPQRGFVNAILRRIGREESKVHRELAAATPDIRYSIPEKLYSRWVRNFGGENAELIAQFVNEPAPTFFVINTLIPGIEAKLATSEVGIEELTRSPGYFRTSNREPIPREWFDAGLVYVQDPAAGIATKLLAPQANETVLDCCAAPGGKSFLIARARNNTGRIIACDNDATRLDRLRANCERLGVTSAEITLADWSDAKTSAHLEVPSAVIIDAPCSNTGVLRRRVDARYRTSAIAPGSIARLQASILATVLERLPVGGRCVYSTCSIDDAENGRNVRSVISTTSGKFDISAEEQSLPHRDQIDGHYAALIRRVS